MINEDLQKILRETASYQAEYIPQPIGSLPSGCSLPGFSPDNLSLSTPPVPDITKDCTYTYDPTPLFIDQFIPPNPCPEGLEVGQTAINILDQVGADTSAGTISLGISKNATNPCGYDLDIPDIVIPCYPSGPLIESKANVTVNYAASPGNPVVFPLSIYKDPDSACHWTFDGDVIVDIPEVPCPDGFVVLPATFRINSTCPTVPHTVKKGQISKKANYDCVYDFTLPDLTIPCYPDGPDVHGTSNIIITDRGVPVSSQPISIAKAPDDCCDFVLDGDVEIDVPCLDGISFAAADFQIIPTGNGAGPAVDKQLTVEQAIDQCNFNVTFPDIEIPCYPNGPQLTSGVSITVGSGPSSPSPQTISIESSNDTPCGFNLAGDINIPVGDQFIRCEDGFDFSGGISVRLRSNTPLIPNSVALSSNESDCGASLAGELDLNLPAFVAECQSLAFSGGITVRLNGAPSSNVINTITLQPNSGGCGATLTGILDLPIPDITIPCLDGFTYGGQITVFQGTQPITGTDNTVTVLPSPGGCGGFISGTLRLPQSGGGGLSYGRWTRRLSYAASSLVSVVQPEGGRCLYVSKEGLDSYSPGPLDPAVSKWESISCEDGKKYRPFKVIQAKPVDNSTDAEKCWVKVVPDSKLFKEKGSIGQRLVRGLDVPFLLEPSKLVYLDITYAALDNSISIIDASVAVGPLDADGWDLPVAFGATTIPSSYASGQDYKHVSPLQAPAVKTSVTSLVSRHVGKTAEQKANTVAAIEAALDTLALNPQRPQAPRMFKAYVLIATSSEVFGTEVIDPEDLAGEVAEPDDAFSKIEGDLDYSLMLVNGAQKYGVTQYVNSHLQEEGSNINGVPTVLIKPYGGQVQTLKLPVPTMTYDGTSGEMTMLCPDAPATVGTAEGNVHIYFTTDGSYPAIDTEKAESTLLYDPANKPILDLTPGEKIVALYAVYPQYRSNSLMTVINV